MSDVKFYRCKHCGNLVAVIEDGGPVPVCCGEPMQLLVAGEVDAAVEKHVPVVTVDGDRAKVSVGEVAHPMTDAHYIQWVAVANGDKLIVKHLHPGDAPEVGFCAHAVEGAMVYAYCNLHGLWKTQA